MKTKSKLVILLLAVLASCWLAWIARPRPSAPTINYTQFLQQVQARRVVDVRITAGSLGAEAASVRLKDGATFQTLLPLDYPLALEAMQKALVNVEIEDSSTSPLHLLINATPFFILLAFWIFFMTIGRPLLERR